MKKNDYNSELYGMKKCPNCFLSLPLEAKTCLVCDIKVGQVQEDGLAGKPVNAPLIAIIFLVIFLCASGIVAWLGFK